MKNILLINPPLRTYFKKEMMFDDFKKKFDIPYGLLSIASFLEIKGFEVSILPMDYYHKHIYDNKKHFLENQENIIKKEIKRLNPKVVGITAYTVQYPNAIIIFQLVKKINPNIITIGGGPHMMFMDKEALDSGAIDIVVRGEGDWTMLDLAQKIESNASYEEVAGISYKKNGKIIRNRERPLGNMKELPVPNYSLLPKNYIQNSNVELMNSRGCYYNCSFCTSAQQYHQTVRPKELSKIIEEITILRNNYGIKQMGLLDESLNANHQYFRELCGALKKFDDMSFFGQTRANFINDADLGLMKMARIKSLVVGAESGSDKVLKAMNKQINFEMVKTACEKIANHKIATGTFWIIGHPGSSPREEEKTLKAMDYLLKNKLSDYIECGIFIPYPGTVVFNNQKKFGIKIFNWNYEKWGRLESRPIYELKNFSREKIYDYWEKAVKLIESYGRKNTSNMPLELK